MNIVWNVHQKKLLSLIYLAMLSTILTLIGMSILFTIDGPFRYVGLLMFVTAWWCATACDTKYHDVLNVLNGVK